MIDSMIFPDSAKYPQNPALLFPFADFSSFQRPTFVPSVTI